MRPKTSIDPVATTPQGSYFAGASASGLWGFRQAFQSAKQQLRVPNEPTAWTMRWTYQRQGLAQRSRSDRDSVSPPQYAFTSVNDTEPRGEAFQAA